MKKLFIFLLVIINVFVLSSCGGQTDWSDVNGYEKAKFMESNHVESDQNLLITIANQENYLKNVEKDKIILKAKTNSSESETKKITAEELKKDAIKDYELKVENNNIAITIPNYEKTIYLVIFNKAITSDNNFAYSYISLLEEFVYSEQPYISAKEDSFVLETVDPIFNVDFKNLTVKDTSKVSFDEAFNQLTVDKCEVSENQLKISTKGKIDNNELGLMKLQKGFFEGNNADLDLYYNIKKVGQSIDQSSIAIKDKQLSFDISFSNKEFTTISTDNIYSVGLDVSKVEIVGDNKNIIRVYSPFEGTIDEAIEKISKSQLYYDENLKDNAFGSLIPSQLNYPSYEVYGEIIEKELVIHFRYHDVVSAGLSAQNVEINSSELTFNGSQNNNSLKEFNLVSNGFDLTIELGKIIDVMSPTLIINTQEGDLKTLWGSDFHFPQLTFSAKQVGNDQLDSNANGEFDESFTKKYLTAKPTIDTLGKALNFIGLAAQFGISVYEGSSTVAIGSLLGLLKMFGLSGDSSNPTIQDVMNKLEDISNLIKSVDRKIDSLKQQVQDDNAALRLGIDKTLFYQYRGFWDGFYRDYIESSENLLRDYTTDMRTYYVNFVRKTEDQVLVLKYFTDDTDKNNVKIVFSIENPNDLGYSLEGFKLSSTKEITLNMSFFESVAELTRKAQGYTNTFDEEFKTCIKNNLKANYSSLSDAELNQLFNDVYAHITSCAQLSAVTQERAKAMRNLFINYADHISGKSTGTSFLNYYFLMLESLYNFQSEAKAEMAQIRVNVKKLLDKFGGFATSMAAFCPGIDKSEITEAYNAAYKYINEHDNLRSVSENEEYSYTLNRKITSKAVRCSFDKGYEKAGTNKCSFFCNYRTYDEVTGKVIDVINKSNLVNDSNLTVIYYRADNIIRTAGKQGEVALYSYFKNMGIISNKVISKYDGTNVITSYDGINSLSSTNFIVICTSYGVGNYFDYGVSYAYRGKKEASCWSGREASGTIYDLNSRTVVSNVIDRLANYDEAHWYWSTDEHWGFEEFLIGRTSLAILKV